jgi:hypothetical protein
MTEQIQFRFLKKNDSIYIRKEDVINYLLEIAATEEIDVRNRLNQAASNINKLGDKNDQ